MEKKTYKVKFLKYEISNGHTEYTIEVVPNDKSKPFQIRDRYCEIRKYWKNMVEEYGNTIVPSTFPPKKWFGNKDPEFITHRKEKLEHFFNSLLEDPKLATSPITQTYFKSKRMKEKPSKPNLPNKKPVDLSGNDNSEDGKGNDGGDERPSVPMSQAQTAASAAMEKKWRQIVEGITKTFIDISFGEEPPPPEEVKKKSLAYAEAISKSLSSLPFISKMLSLPKGNEKSYNEINLKTVENEKPMSQYLDEKMDIINKIVRNENSVLYPKDSIAFKFEMTL